MYEAFLKTGFCNRRAFSYACCAILLSILSAAIPMFLVAGNATPAESAITEYEVKAAYVYYFAKFIDWPASTFSDKNAPLIIGIIGDNEFGSLLSNIVKSKTAQEHPIVVRTLKWPVDLHSCQMVYISASEQKRYKQIVESLQAYPILTITETEEGLLGKGILNLFMEGSKVQFEVDLAGAEKAQLRISSKLLRLARGTAGKGLGKE
jgi:hypothetical protein